MAELARAVLIIVCEVVSDLRAYFMGLNNSLAVDKLALLIQGNLIIKQARGNMINPVTTICFRDGITLVNHGGPLLATSVSKVSSKSF